MEVSQLRLARTQFHRRIGLFGYSSVLNALSVRSPVRQICAIGAFAERVLGPLVVMPTFDSDSELLAWVRRGLEDVMSWPQIEAQSTADLANRTYAYIAWDPSEGFAELLNAQCGAEAMTSASKRLRRSGVNLRVNELLDLTEPFLRSYLPNAVQSFRFPMGLDREQFWLSKVLYRFALHEAISDRTNREHLSVLRPSDITLWTDDTTSLEPLLEAVPQALDSLDVRERTALELYFGFSGRPQTFAEIATRLGTSEYFARAAVIKGLATASARLGVQGTLTPQEFELSRRLFDVGMSLDAAASDLRITRREAQQLSASISKAFRRALRPRTGRGPGAETHSKPVKDTIMAPTFNVLEIEPERIVSTLERLTSTPRLVCDRDGIAYVYLADLSAKLPLAYIRQIALHPDNLKRLEQAGTELEWLAQRDATLDRPDVDAQYLAWTAQLRALAKRSWEIAETLYQLCLDRLRDSSKPVPSEDQLYVVQRIHRVLTGTARTLEGTLPRELRARRIALLRIDWSDRKAIARWEDSRSDVHFDLVTDVVRQRSLDLPDMPELITEVLPDVMVEGIHRGDIHLPNFEREAQVAKSTVWLRWIPPSFDEIVKVTAIKPPRTGSNALTEVR
jgi:hypothetical protein